MDLTTNNCGPFWSDGSFQNSVCSVNTRPVDEFDFTCADHDCAVYLATSYEDIRRADNKFFTDNVGLSAKRTLAAYLVYYGHPLFYMKYRPFGFDIDPVSGKPFVYNPGIDTTGVNKSKAYADWIRDQQEGYCPAATNVMPKMVTWLQTIPEDEIYDPYFSPLVGRFSLRDKTVKRYKKKNRSKVNLSRYKN